MLLFVPSLLHPSVVVLITMRCSVYVLRNTEWEGKPRNPETWNYPTVAVRTLQLLH
jgi:hypothetical protein